MLGLAITQMLVAGVSSVRRTTLEANKPHKLARIGISPHALLWVGEESLEVATHQP